VADFSRQWNSYRRWSRLGLATIVLYVVAMAVALMATEGKPGRGWVLLALGAVFAVLFVWFAVKASRFPCPRCGQQFNIKLPDRVGLPTRQCAHCGLAFGANG
jgi:hypothetical protein